MEATTKIPVGDDARTAFWINAYNDGLLRLIESRPMRRSVLLDLRRFSGPVVEVGGLSFSLNQIEHGILRGNRRPPASMRPTIFKGDPRLDFAPSVVDPRIHFALNCGARSCPPIRRYEGEVLDEQLELATRGYLQSESRADSAGCRVELPGLMKLYRADFGDSETQLRFVCVRVEEIRDAVTSCGKPIEVSYRRFDWRRA